MNQSTGPANEMKADSWWEKRRLRRIPIDERKSKVRVFVTILAAWYVFGVSAALVGALWIDALDGTKLQIAKDVYMTVLPVATGIITYWFASRGRSSENNSTNKEQPEHEIP